MTLMKDKKIIVCAKRSQNLFILDQAIPGKIIALRRKRWLIYLVSQNKKIRIWHLRLSYASKTKVICASKLVDGINLDLDSKYNPEEMLIYLDVSFNKTGLSELKLIELLKLEDIEPANCIFARLMLPKLGHIDLANQISESHLHDLNFENIKLCIVCVFSKSMQVMK